MLAFDESETWYLIRVDLKTYSKFIFIFMSMYYIIQGLYTFYVDRFT